MKNPSSPFIKDGIEYHHGWVYTTGVLNSIEGNQMSIIEAMGLPERQEKAIKSQIRQALYRPQRLAIFLTSEEVASHGSDEAAEPNDEEPLSHNQIAIVD